MSDTLSNADLLQYCRDLAEEIRALRAQQPRVWALETAARNLRERVRTLEQQARERADDTDTLPVLEPFQYEEQCLYCGATGADVYSEELDSHFCCPDHLRAYAKFECECEIAERDAAAPVPEEASW